MCFINNIYINHKLLELSVQAPRRAQLLKAAALCMYTRQKVLSFKFLYTGGNYTCRTEQNRRQQKRRKHKTVKERRTSRKCREIREQNRRKQNRQENLTKRRATMKNMVNKSCATQNKLFKNLLWTANKRQRREAKISKNTNQQTLFRLTNQRAA